MSSERDSIDRILELLADRATGGLAASDRGELDRLMAEHAGVDEEEMDRVAAAALVAMAGEEQPMPAAVRARVLGALEGDTGGLRLVGAGAPAARRAPVAAWAGWVAAAACLAVAVFLAVGRGPVDPERARSEFLRTASDVRAASWADWDNPEVPGVRGRVEWSESAQKGYMVFEGLRPNDPSAEQYQLWIIDERGLEQRISGGVFNAATGETVVEIDPAVEIHGAAAFAITIERPGGVWVSDMTRRVVIASLDG